MGSNLIRKKTLQPQPPVCCQ